MEWNYIRVTIVLVVSFCEAKLKVDSESNEVRLEDDVVATALSGEPLILQLNDKN